MLDKSVLEKDDIVQMDELALSFETKSNTLRSRQCQPTQSCRFFHSELRCSTPMHGEFITVDFRVAIVLIKPGYTPKQISLANHFFVLIRISHPGHLIHWAMVSVFAGGFAQISTY